MGFYFSYIGFNSLQLLWYTWHYAKNTIWFLEKKLTWDVRRLSWCSRKHLIGGDYGHVVVAAAATVIVIVIVVVMVVLVVTVMVVFVGLVMVVVMLVVAM